MKRGRFCVFEGLDGSGKTTLISSLAGYPGEHGIKSIFVDSFSGLLILKEPSDLPTGRRIKKMLSEEKSDNKNWIQYFLDDRTQNIKVNIRPAIKKKMLIFQDRYYYSTAAYQGDFTGSLNPHDIIKMNRDLGFLEPDVLFYLDLIPERALERIMSTRDKPETFETLNHLKRVYHNYQMILPENTIMLNAQEPIEKLTEDVIHLLRKKWKNLE